MRGSDIARGVHTHIQREGFVHRMSDLDAKKGFQTRREGFKGSKTGERVQRLRKGINQWEGF